MEHKYGSVQNQVEQQLKNILCVDIDAGGYMDRAAERAEYALSYSANKYYTQGQSRISQFNTGQYCLLLYYLSNEMFISDKCGANAEKVYYLNKILNSIDIFYEVNMPRIFGVEHPLGSVMGRSVYGDRFFFYQGCTVGGSNGHYPTLGEGVIMYSNSKILGNCHVGNNVIMSANSYIVDRDVPDNSIVFGQGRDAVIKPITEERYFEKTSQFWK